MEAQTKRIFGKALLLSPTAREQLADALYDSLGDEPPDLDAQDFGDVNEILDELIAEADSLAKQRRRSDGDVPRQWRSLYFLRQGYHIELGGRRRREHWQGGRPRHKNAVCSSCSQRLHLIWEIDCTDRRFREETETPFGKLTRLPLYYCLHCPHPTVYRCTPQRLQMLETVGGDGGESPFSGFSDEFPRLRLGLKPIPGDVEVLLSVCEHLGSSWLRPEHRRCLAEYFRVKPAHRVALALGRSQFGGIPMLLQRRAAMLCPYDRCPTHAWGHPLTRDARSYRMKPLATVGPDCGLEMESYGAQITFRICWACQTVHSYFHVD